MLFKCYLCDSIFFNMLLYQLSFVKKITPVFLFCENRGDFTSPSYRGSEVSITPSFWKVFSSVSLSIRDVCTWLPRRRGS